MDTSQHLIAARELLQTAEDILPKQRRTSAAHGYKTAAITWHRRHKSPEPQAGKVPLLWSLFSSKKFLSWKSYYNQLWTRYPPNGTHNLQRQYTSNVWRQRLCPDCSYTITEQTYALKDNAPLIRCFTTVRNNSLTLEMFFKSGLSLLDFGCRLCAAVWRFTCVHLWIFGCMFSSNCFSCLQVLHHSPLSCCAKL
jgi:hypothetical protein